MYLFQLASFLRIRGRKSREGEVFPSIRKRWKTRIFSNINFSTLFLSGISNRRKGRRSIMRASGREDITEERVVLLCNIDMPTISYFPPCYVDQRGGIIGRIDRWFSAKLIDFFPAIYRVNWKYLCGFYSYSYGAKDWQKSLTRIFHSYFIARYFDQKRKIALSFRFAKE